MGQAVYEAALGEKELVKVEGAGHLDHDTMGSFDQIFAWMDSHYAGGRKGRVEDAGGAASKAR